MPKLTPEMKEMIKKQLCFVATVNADGAPTLGPKRTARVVDDEYLAFNEMTGKGTWANVLRGSGVAIAVADPGQNTGYRFEGSAEILTAGRYFDQAAAVMRIHGKDALLHGVIKVKVERIFNLGIPDAGKRTG